MPDNPLQQQLQNFISLVFPKMVLFFGKAVKIFEKAAVRIARKLSRFFKKMLIVLKYMVPSFLLGMVLFVLLFWTGLGDIIGNEIAALTGSIPAILIIIASCFIPAVSPMLGPGLLIAVAAALFTGERIAAGAAVPFLALTALLAIDAQVGGNFIPPGHVLGENEPETINAGVPGIVFTRLLTVPAALVLASIFSFLQQH